MVARAAVFFLLAAVLVAAASAQSSGSGSDDCTSALVSLSPCMDYISGNGSSSPSASCCSQLKSVVQSKPQCLCSVIGGGASSSVGGITIDRERALGLPSACNVQTPSASQCNAGERPPAANCSASFISRSSLCFSLLLPLSFVAERKLTPRVIRSIGAGSSGSGGGGSKSTPSLPSGAAALRGPAGLVLGLAVAVVYAVSAAA